MAAIWAWIDWLKNTVVGAWDWIHSFVSNPYPYIAALLNWVYYQGVNFTNAVKREIADWTYGLIGTIWEWIHWLNNLYNQVVLPVVNAFYAWVSNISVQIYNTVRDIIGGIIGQIWGNITAIIDWLRTLSANVGAIWDNVVNWVSERISWVVSYVATIASQFQQFDPSYIIERIGEILRFIYDIDLTIQRTVLDHLLRWLEEVLAEAMER